MKSSSNSAVEWAAALALASQVYLFVFSAASFTWLSAAQAATLLTPIVAVIAGAPVRLKVSLQSTLTILALPALLVANLIINERNYRSDPTVQYAAVHVLGFSAYLIWLNWLATSVNIQRVLSKLAWALVPILSIALAVLIKGTGSGRAAPFGIHPNWWGELVIAFAISASAIRARNVRVMMWAGGALLLYFVQSRSGMVGWVIVIGVNMLRAWNSGTSRRKVGMLALVVALAMGLFASSAAVSFISDRVLLLNNAYRGLGTGLTGRVQGWDEAILAFLREPIFGNGIDTFTFVHNGFLQLLSEGGLTLSALVLTILVIGMRRAWKARDYLRLAALMSVSGYVIVQPRMINVNLTSLLFWLATFDWQVPHMSGSAYTRPGVALV